jgi:hypothetical protein
MEVTMKAVVSVLFLVVMTEQTFGVVCGMYDDDECGFYADAQMHTEMPGLPSKISMQPVFLLTQTRLIFFTWSVETSYFAGDKITISPAAGWTFNQCPTLVFGLPFEQDKKTPTIDANMDMGVDGAGVISGGKYIYTFTQDLLWNPDGYTESWVVPNPFEVCVRVTAPNFVNSGTIIFTDTQGNDFTTLLYALSVLPSSTPLDLSTPYIFNNEIYEYLIKKTGTTNFDKIEFAGLNDQY